MRSCDPPVGEFGNWLYDNVIRTDKSITEIAIDLMMDNHMIGKHIAKKGKPRFATIIAYCWYFDNNDDPYDIWNLVEKDYKIKRRK